MVILIVPGSLQSDHHPRPPSLDDSLAWPYRSTTKSSHISSELRASLFRVAARIPGVKITEDAVDPEGRRGVTASIVYDDQNGSLMEVERIFDKDTTQLMAETQTVVGKTAFQMSSPPPGFPKSANRAMGPPTLNTPPGTVVGSAVYLKSGTVSAVGETPSGP